MSIQQKLTALTAIFQQMEKALIAYSGGVDSSLVAKVAYDVLGDKALAITGVSPSLLPEELDEAQQQAEWIGIRHELIETEEMNNPNYTANPVNRCYFCKSELHDKLKIIAQQRGYPYIIDGVNVDDLRDYRPGIQAARERGVRSPLAEVGISKIEVRKSPNFWVYRGGISLHSLVYLPVSPMGRKSPQRNYTVLGEQKFIFANWDTKIYESDVMVTLPESN